MDLILRVTLPDGRFHGVPEWPPAPARLFQALVAGASRGRSIPADAQAALLWLESLAPPAIAAPHATAGQRLTSYVPNNDGGANKLGDDPRAVIRSPKRQRPLLFDPAAPILYVWEGAGEVPEGVAGLADGLFQFGRGIDPAFAVAEAVAEGQGAAALLAHGGPVWRPGGPGAGGLACPRAGSLASLGERHLAFLGRFASIGQGRGSVTAFRQPPRAEFAAIRYGVAPAAFLYAIRRPDGRFRAIPAAQAAGLVKGLIAAAVERLARALPARKAEVERFLKGSPGAPAADLARRVRVIPLPTVRDFVDRAIRRVLVEVPGTCPLRADDVAWAFNGLAMHDWVLEPMDMDAPAGRYLKPARLWRSETPLVLEAAPRRRLGPGGTKRGTERAGEEARAAAAVMAALRHAGVAEAARVTRVQREPFAAQGTEAGAFAAPGTRFAERKHALWHAEIAFARPLDRQVEGPLLLGDGRFAGLGLMLPVTLADTAPAGWAFAIAGGLAPGTAPEALAFALRRAVMARVRDTLGPGARDGLPAFFSGHEPDGAPAAARHLACVADLARARLLVLAPHAFHRRAPDAGEEPHLATLDTALAGLAELRAGPAGLLRLAPAPFEAGDPLLAPARIWESLTPYRPTRHPKREEAAEALARDLAAEASRRNLPRPAVTVLEVTEGPRGGLAARLRLAFARAVPGPVLLGRDLHRGGGLFGPAE